MIGTGKHFLSDSALPSPFSVINRIQRRTDSARSTFGRRYSVVNHIDLARNQPSTEQSLDANSQCRTGDMTIIFVFCFSRNANLVLHKGIDSDIWRAQSR